MPKLNQILAIEKGEKTRAQRAHTELHKKSLKEALYDGRIRTYHSIDEEGDSLPPEKQLVQLRVKDVLAEQARILIPLWDVAATKDWTNLEARADVVVDGQILIEKCPVSYLLFLEKWLSDIETFTGKLPTLDPSEEWKFSEEQNCHVTDSVMTNRSKKVMRNHVKASATPEHPAQVETYQEDQTIGRYLTIRHSGALPAQRHEELMQRVLTLKKAVLFAREQANNHDAVKKEVGKTLFDFLLA